MRNICPAIYGMARRILGFEEEGRARARAGKVINMYNFNCWDCRCVKLQV